MPPILSNSNFSVNLRSSNGQQDFQKVSENFDLNGTQTQHFWRSGHMRTVFTVARL